MTLVNPIATPNPVVQTGNVQLTTPEERQVDLRLEQIVRATVVEGGLDRALLEMNHRHYRAQSDLELQTGQKLTLQVLQTHPKLEFRVLQDPLGGRLSQLLPLLTKSYDWSGLVGQLQQQAPQTPQAPLPAAMAEVYSRLQQLLQPAGTASAGVHEEVARLGGQLQQLIAPKDADGRPPATSQAASTQAYQAASPSVPAQPQIAPADPGLTRLLENLQQQLQQLPQPGPASAATSELPGLLAELRQQLNLPPQQARQLEQLLAQLGQELKPSTAAPAATAAGLSREPAPPAVTAPVTGPALQVAETVVGHLRQLPNLDPKLTAELERLLTQLTPTKSQPSGPAAENPTRQPGPAPPAAAVEQQAVSAQQGRTLTDAAGMPARELVAGLEKLVAHVQELQGQKNALAPDLLGRLEGLLTRIRQLPQGAEVALPVLPGLEQIAGQLNQLVQQQALRPEGGQLGFLSQLFGFHLEAELLAGKQKAALASLKLSLLQLRKELSKTVEEPLQRLELFQLCKAKLAEENLQFLPLPFAELEEGYLLVEEQRKPDGEESEPPLQLSLSLRLSGLGEMRVDMLYEKTGLHLRLACEDKAKMQYLQEHAATLQEMLTAVPLQGVSFAADAQSPARQLLELLLPSRSGVLDDRV